MTDEVKAPGNIPAPAMIIIVTGAFMAFLDSSIVNVALPHMMTVFNASSSDIQWVLTAYMLTQGVIIPASAFLCGKFGQRRVYLWALLIFTIGSALCGLCWSLGSMIAARILQALGGGLLVPVSMSIIYYMVPREKLGMAMGIWGLSAILGPAVGPTLGGYLIDTLSWEWIFFVNVPVGLLASLLCPLFVPESNADSSIPMDIGGIILIALACFTLLLALSQGQDKGWSSQYIVSLFIIAVYSFIAFYFHEKSAPYPLIDLRVFSNPVVIFSLAATSLVTIGMLGAIFIIPIYAQNLLGYSPLHTGTLMLPMALTSALLMPVSGKIYDRFGAFSVGLIGIGLAAVVTFSLRFLSLDTSYSHLQWLLALRAVGFGLAMMPIANTAMSAVPEELAAGTSAIINTIRQIASSLGIALVTYVFTVRQVYNQALMADSFNVSSYAAQEVLYRLQSLISSQLMVGNETARAAALQVVNGMASRQAAMQAIDDVLVVLALVITMALPLVFLLKQKQVNAAQVAQAKALTR